MSGRFTPAAWTLINAWPGPGIGIGRSQGFNTSGGPGWVISIARMMELSTGKLHCIVTA
jgi:hypothetical protein